MEDNKFSDTKQISPPTGVFDVPKDAPTRPMELVGTGTGVFPAEGASHKNISEKTLKKRLARLAASPLVLSLAVLMSVSAVMTALRGYFWPVTATLTAGRALAATALWLIYATAGKKGGRLLAALSLYMAVIGVTVFSLMGVFTFCAMFGKLFLFGGENAVQLVRTAHSAGLWSVVPALVFFVIAYCLYLFKRHERLITCNVRDALLYGFPFEKGNVGFMSSCVVTAFVFTALQIASGAVGSFSCFESLGKEGAALFDKLFMSNISYWLNFLGVLVHSAALLVAGVAGNRYSAIVKKYKLQKGIKQDDKTKTKPRDAVQ